MRHLCWHDTSEQNSCQSSDVETVLSFLRTISFRALHVLIDNGLYFVYLVNKRILVAAHLGWNECSNWRNKLKKNFLNVFYMIFPWQLLYGKICWKKRYKGRNENTTFPTYLCSAKEEQKTCLMTTNDVSLRNEIQVNLPFREFFPVSN